MEILKEPVRDASAWLAADYREDFSWIHTLTPAELAELDAALREVKAAGTPPPEFSREQFRIPAFGQRLQGLVREFEQGRGFFLIRGLPIEKYSLDELKAIYWGIGTHMGMPVLQNKKGDLVSHVEDRGDDYARDEVRLYTTAAAANPHNDPSDVAGLLCVRASPSGGASMIASAISVYNRLLAEHPEYLEVLCCGFPHAVRGEGSTRKSDETTPDIPIFSYFQGKLSCCINSKSSKTARAQQGRPMSEFELAALRCVEDIAVTPELCLSTDFRPGDMQFLNNYVIIHTRTAFQDGREPGQRRLLLRLWMNLRQGRPLAPGFGDRFNNGSRGGVPALAVEAAAR